MIRKFLFQRPPISSIARPVLHISFCHRIYRTGLFIFVFLSPPDSLAHFSYLKGGMGGWASETRCEGRARRWMWRVNERKSGNGYLQNSRSESKSRAFPGPASLIANQFLRERWLCLINKSKTHRPVK